MASTDPPTATPAPLTDLPDPTGLGAVESLPVEQWAGHRPKLLDLFRGHIYGDPPAVDPAMAVEIIEHEPRALNGRCTRWQVELVLGAGSGRQEPGGAAPSAAGVRLAVLALVPNQAAGPVSAFAGLNFHGNHTVHPDPAIALPSGWVAQSEELGVVGHAATAVSRGLAASRWPVETILGRGHALLTAYAGDIDPDFDDGFANGIHALETAPRGPRSGGTIAAWAWGLSRVLDWAVTVNRIDSGAVFAIGHSRMGKAALWAAAEDDRFAGAISSGSGCLGAAMSRRCMGERISDITSRFPHWFCRRCAAYAGREHEMPIDQHLLVGLIAPRPVYVASAAQDAWADPEGEFAACVHADAIYRKLGRRGLGTDRPPPLNESVGEGIGYHIRPGAHDLMPADWWHFLDFVERRARRGWQG